MTSLQSPPARWWADARHAIRSPIVLNTVIAAVAAVVVIAVLIAAVGYNPAGVFAAMVEGSVTGPGLVTTLQRSVPVIGLALALSFSFRAGQFNLGAEGQFVAGGMVGAMVALALPGPGWLAVLAAAAAAMAAGAALSTVSALLFTRLAAPVFATTLLLNYLVEPVTSYAVNSFWKDPATSMVATRRIADERTVSAVAPPQSWLESVLVRFAGEDHIITLVATGLDWSVAVVAAVFAVTVFIDRYLPIGFESKLVGLNPGMAQKVGVRIDRVIITNMAVGGGIAGLMGILVVLGSHFRFIDGALVGTGYAVTALLVVMLARSSPAAVVITGIVFTAIGVGGQAVERDYGLSSYVSTTLQALAVILVSVRLVSSSRFVR